MRKLFVLAALWSVCLVPNLFGDEPKTIDISVNCDGNPVEVAITNGTPITIRGLRNSGACSLWLSCLKNKDQKDQQEVGASLYLSIGQVVQSFSCSSQATSIVVKSRKIEGAPKGQLTLIP
jgi:hypothetical protein